MTLNKDITVKFEDDSFEGSGYRTWIKMEQVSISETSNTADLYDIFQMMGSAASGLTSRSYTPEGLDYVRFQGNNILIDLDFWVFPSDLDLAYSLKINQGTISGKSFEDVPKTGNIVVPLSRQVQLEYLINEASASLSWETPVYNDIGNVLANPEIIIDGPYIEFDQKVFGIIRANIAAKGYRYTATLSFPKTEQEDVSWMIRDQTTFASIKNVKASVICSYKDENGKSKEEVLTLKIPGIVADLLESCPGQVTAYHDPCFWSDDPWACHDNEKAYTTRIYYSTCDGEILDTIRSDGKPVSDEYIDSWRK